ncbi:hypothetical protein V6N13_053261 [Hibiscus sabdariffa]|uniref:Uncharacterized protein n=2 Tax=Hibiscus sabdariffa TaxID=183260 RepID=A0ABR2Q742_9ROSI
MQRSHNHRNTIDHTLRTCSCSETYEWVAQDFGSRCPHRNHQPVFAGTIQEPLKQVLWFLYRWTDHPIELLLDWLFSIACLADRVPFHHYQKKHIPPSLSISFEISTGYNKTTSRRWCAVSDTFRS